MSGSAFGSLKMEISMKKITKKLAALALAASLCIAPAGAITQDGQSETWFDSVWALINTFGLKAENNPYVLQNYINKYLQEHPEEMYNVIKGTGPGSPGAGTAGYQR